MANRQLCWRFCNKIASSIGNLIFDASYAALAERIRAVRVVVTKAGAVPGLASALVTFP